MVVSAVVCVVTNVVCCCLQGEVGEHGQKGGKGDKGEHVSDITAQLPITQLESQPSNQSLIPLASKVSQYL